MISSSQHVYEVRPRKDHRGVDLICDALPFGRLWYGEPNAITNAIGYNITAATDFNSLSGVTGISVPVSLLDCPKCGGRMSLSREQKGSGGNFVCWYRCDQCAHELPGLHGYKAG
jgi:hypothetical protein